MTNHCVEREKIFALALQMLAEREQHEVSAHLKSCENCRALLANYRRLDSVLDDWTPAAEPSPWFDARVRSAVATQRSRPSGFLGLSWGGSMAAPALASLLLVASVVMVRNGRLANRAVPAVAQAVNVAPVKPAARALLPAAKSGQAAAQELKMYQNMPVLEDYDMLTDFDVISELPKGSHKIAD